MMMPVHKQLVKLIAYSSFGCMVMNVVIIALTLLMTLLPNACGMHEIVFIKLGVAVFVIEL